jgi:hypothetical protein
MRYVFYADLFNIYTDHVHSEDQCDDSFPCVLHSPSRHRMTLWPAEVPWFVVHRRCEHGYLHVDPDSLDWALRSVHPREVDGCTACDGCCGRKVTRPPSLDTYSTAYTFTSSSTNTNWFVI